MVKLSLFGYTFVVQVNLLVEEQIMNKILEQLKRNNDSVDYLSSLEKDVFSSTYEMVLSKEERRYLGQFFTHKKLVDFLIDKIPIAKTDKILDPACGCGAFLLSLKTNFRIPIDSLYGIDIDPNIIQICRSNILDENQSNNNIILADTINSDIKSIFSDVKEGFDVIIGNPPYKNLKRGVDYQIDDPEYGDIIFGVANSASLFIGKCFNALKPGGYLGFVLPKNFLRVDSFKKIRNFLLFNSSIKHIFDIDHYFKDVRGDQILLIIQKNESNIPIKTNDINIHIIKKGMKFDKPYHYIIAQRELLGRNIYPVYYDERMFEFENIFMSNGPTLQQISNNRIFRGMDINRQQLFTSPNNLNDPVKVLKGDSLQNFGIKKRYYIEKNILDTYDQIKLIKMKSSKVVIQNIFSKESGIIGSLSDSNEVCLDTVTCIIVDENIEKYIMALLNSDLANFYFIFYVFLNSNFTMHTDKTYIGNFPVKMPDKIYLETINILVNNLVKLDRAYSIEYNKIINKINDIIYLTYGITNSQRELIKEFLSEVMGRNYGRKNE